MIESNINAITVAAISTLPVEKSLKYIRNLLKDETYELIKNEKFTTEVKKFFFNNFYLIKVIKSDFK